MPTDRSKKDGSKKSMTLCDRLRSLFSRDKEEVRKLRDENEKLQANVAKLEEANSGFQSQVADLRAQLAEIQEFVEAQEKVREFSVNRKPSEKEVSSGSEVQEKDADSGD